MGRVFFGSVAVIRWLPVVARRTVCLPHVLPPAKYFHPHSAAASSHAIQSVIGRARAARRLRLTLLVIVSSAQFAQTASAQSVATDTPQPIDERGPLSVGFYAGELYKSEYISILYRPQDIQLSPSYLVAANVDYRIYKSADIPIQFEGEFDIAKRFHGADEFDVVLAPLFAGLGFHGTDFFIRTCAWGRIHPEFPPGNDKIVATIVGLIFCSSAPWRCRSQHTRMRTARSFFGCIIGRASLGSLMA